MKKLSQFLYFDWDLFAEDKEFVVTRISDWSDHDTGQYLGTRVAAVILKDNTPYETKPGELVSNQYETVVFKTSKKISIPLNTRVQALGVIATVYGDYRDKLSITADDVVPVSPK